MDRLWGALAGCLTAVSILTLWLGAWGWSLVTGIVGSIIIGLLVNDEIYLPLGPVRFLRTGKVWALDFGRVGIYGIGGRVRLRRVKVD